MAFPPTKLCILFHCTNKLDIKDELLTTNLCRYKCITSNHKHRLFLLKLGRIKTDNGIMKIIITLKKEASLISTKIGRCCGGKGLPLLR